MVSITLLAIFLQYNLLKVLKAIIRDPNLHLNQSSIMLPTQINWGTNQVNSYLQNGLSFYLFRQFFKNVIITYSFAWPLESFS